MSDILSIRLRPGEKAELEEAAASAQESVAEFVRNAVRQRRDSKSESPWEKRFGSADRKVAPPTNENVRRAMARGRKA